jgi:rare lipoprotein A
MEYKVQRGDTIAHVSKVMGSDWQTLKKLNPQAVGRSQTNGNWFVREGAVLSDQTKTDFGSVLKSAESRATLKNKGTGSSQGQEKSTAAQMRTHTLKAGETVWDLATKTYHVEPEDILKANNISEPRSLQIGRTLDIPHSPKQPDKGRESVVASWYGQNHHGQTMANGQPFDMFASTIAHKDIPLGTKVLLENPETGQQVTATVTDRGPYIQGRDVDLSYKLAQRLSLDKQGVGNLTMQVL